MSPYFSNPPDPIYELLPGASLNLTCVAVGLPMPYVSWRQGERDIRIESNSLPIGRSILRLADIRQSANYTCIAQSRFGTIEAHTAVIVQMVPRSSTDVKITEVTSSSVRVSWSYDAVDEDKIDFFVIRYKSRDSDEFSEISGIRTFFYTVASLEPFTIYEFYILAVNSVGPGRPSDAASVTTGDDGKWQ